MMPRIVSTLGVNTPANVPSWPCFFPGVSNASLSGTDHYGTG